MDYTPAATPHSEYVLVETVGSDDVVIRKVFPDGSPSWGVEVIKHGIGARMPLRQALEFLDLASKQTPKAKLKISGVVRQLEPGVGKVGEYVPGSTIENDPIRKRDELGFPLIVEA